MAIKVTGTTVIDDSRNILNIPTITTTKVAETNVSIGNSGTASNINLAQGTVFTSTLTGNCTFTIQNASNAAAFILVLTNDATPNRTVAWAGGTFRFPGGNSALSRTTTANGVDVWSFFSPDAGTTWYGNITMIALAA